MAFEVDTLTVEDILNNSELLYSKYLGKIKLDKRINSPLRLNSDSKSFVLSVYKSMIIYKDFVSGESGNVISFVAKYEKVSNSEATKICFKLLKSNPKIKSSKRVIESSNIIKNNSEPSDKFRAEYRDFHDYDLKYWAKLNVDINILEKFNVKCVSKLYCNNILKWQNSQSCPIYEYDISYKGNKKWYRPKSFKGTKHIGNIKSYSIMGLKQLPEASDLIIISKAYKDVLVLYSLGYNAICAASESIILKQEQIDLIKSKCSKIVVLLDNDKTGLEKMQRYKEIYNLECIVIDKESKCKDIAEYIERYKVENTKEFLKNNLK